MLAIASCLPKLVTSQICSGSLYIVAYNQTGARLRPSVYVPQPCAHEQCLGMLTSPCRNDTPFLPDAIYEIGGETLNSDDAVLESLLWAVRASSLVRLSSSWKASNTDGRRSRHETWAFLMPMNEDGTIENFHAKLVSLGRRVAPAMHTWVDIANVLHLIQKRKEWHGVVNRMLQRDVELLQTATSF